MREPRRRALALALGLGMITAVAACAGEPPAGGDDIGPDADAPDAPPPPDAPDVEDPPGELRGLWITRFEYGDADELEGIIDRAAAANFNAVFVQIRGQGDAYYRSAHEPWAAGLSGVLGRDPGWDPLQVAIDRARLHGIEIHAYFNVFSAWTASAPVPQAEGPIQHPLVAHPDWLAVDSSGTNRDSEYRWFSPGNPAVRAHIAETARDLLATYDVDGLHLDRIRVPGPDYSRDAASEAAFDAARADDPALTWGDFMRAQVDRMVAELYDVIAETRPAARLSAAVWGIYEPLPGCNTSQGFGQYYQDSLAWLADGTIDAIVPMIYWRVQPGACTDFAALLDGFVADDAGRHVWGGMHALDRVDGVSTWVPEEVGARIDHARAAGAQGVVVFASSYLDADPARWDALVGTADAPGPFHEPIATPRMPWKE